LGEKRAIEIVNDGNNSIDSKRHKLKQKGHPHPWRDGTPLGQVC